MFNALKPFGFCDYFINWMSVLYKDVSSSLIVYHCISNSFSLTRSVRQGCSLSPLLYVLCLEPFARAIQNDSFITGIYTPDNRFYVQMSLYADDNTTILTITTNLFVVSLIMFPTLKKYLVQKLITKNQMVYF